MTHPQIALWESAANEFDQRHELVEPHHLSLSTPCDDFDVAALIEHAVGTQERFAKFLGGPALDGSHWATARANMADTLSDERCLDGVANHPGLGTLPKEKLLAIATNDMLIHTWDLAHAIGADETLPDASLEAAIEGVRTFPEGPRKVLFSEPIELENNDDLLKQLLAISGRMR